jgi:alpha-galactosidase
VIEFVEKDRLFHLFTKDSSYVIQVLPSLHVGHLHYGGLLSSPIDPSKLQLKHTLETGGQVVYEPQDKTFSLNLTRLELSTYGKGDFRDPSIHIRFEDGSRIADFKYVSHEILKEKPVFSEMPQTFEKADRSCVSLKIIVADLKQDLFVDLYYSVFYDINIITRRSVIRNGSNQKILLEKAMSMNLDFAKSDFELLTLDGAWIRERHLHSRPLTYGIVKIDSKKGVSSSDHNPFIALKRKNTDEELGECYGFSLLYSGNFEASCEVSPHSMLRVLFGVNSFDFYWNLEKNSQFVTPEAVMTYSKNGLASLSHHFHSLVNNHIVNPIWQMKERPILINNWEATYFDFNEKKLVKLAKSAKKLGIELFVLDDGWFGKRDDDKSSLGDWTVNLKKLPGGIKRLSSKINRIGLDFGIWVEPEMISPDSDLYKKHPDWALKHPNYEPSYGRNQLVLDLSNHLVREYIIQVLSTLFEDSNVKYCKWDMNRNFSDLYSSSLSNDRQGELSHRYVLGLYDILHTLTKRFPHILFESCASGGNRFDLGMLYYMPQTWTSDNTDGIERLYIQYGTSMLYPLSTMGAHVSNTPNQQVLRITPLETRFNTAMFGLLGYELDLTNLSSFEKSTIKDQIAYYKKHRRMLQFGEFTRIKSPFEDNRCYWMVTNEAKDEALVGIYQLLEKPNQGFEVIPIKQLSKNNQYEITNRTQYFHLSMFGHLIHHALPIKLKPHGHLFLTLSNHYRLQAEKENQIIAGDILYNMGFVPKHNFIGTGYNDSIRLMGDYGSRVYHFKSIRKGESYETRHTV